MLNMKLNNHKKMSDKVNPEEDMDSCQCSFQKNLSTQNLCFILNQILEKNYKLSNDVDRRLKKPLLIVDQ